MQCRKFMHKLRHCKWMTNEWRKVVKLNMFLTHLVFVKLFLWTENETLSFTIYIRRKYTFTVFVVIISCEILCSKYWYCGLLILGTRFGVLGDCVEGSSTSSLSSSCSIVREHLFGLCDISPSMLPCSSFRLSVCLFGLSCTMVWGTLPSSTLSNCFWLRVILLGLISVLSLR